MIKPNTHIRTLQQYIPGEQPQTRDFIKLNTNENPYPASPHVVKSLADAIRHERIRLYPDPLCKNLRKAAGRRWRVPADAIFVSNGSDEALRLLFQAYLEPGDSVAALFPTYTLYETYAQLFGAEIIYYNLKSDLALPKHFFKRMKHKIICIANPNPPYGTFYDIDEVAGIIKANRSSLVIVDEAYVDFAPGNALSIIKYFDNVIVTRSFSKSYGMAGLRIGFGISAPPIIETLYKSKDSYNVNFAAQVAATAAFEDYSYYKQNMRKLIASRTGLSRELKKLGFSVPESAANFIFARWKSNAQFLYAELKKRKILVRYFSNPVLADGLRISIGTEDENKALVGAIKEIIKP